MIHNGEAVRAIKFYLYTAITMWNGMGAVEESNTCRYPDFERAIASSLFIFC